MRIKDEKIIEERKKEITEYALQIIKEEGLQKLSMRKIAAKMQQTVGILYHYFENKEAILTYIVESGYQDILASLKPKENLLTIEASLEASILQYCACMIAKEEIFLLLMNSKDKVVQERTYMLNEQVLQRQSMQMLMGSIQEGIHQGLFVCQDVTKKAQWIWCATYGVITRIIQEKPSQEIQESLLAEHVVSILASLRR